MSSEEIRAGETSSRAGIGATLWTNGFCVEADSQRFSLDATKDARLEGCVERLKKRRLEFLGMHSAQVFEIVAESVFALHKLPERSSKESNDDDVEKEIALRTKKTGIFRRMAAKYLLDRVGIASRFSEHGGVELVSSWAEGRALAIPHVFNDDTFDSWRKEDRVRDFFETIDLERLPEDSIVLKAKIYKGIVSSIYEGEFRGSQCAIKLVNVEELDSPKISSLLREMDILREISGPSRAEGIVQYHGYHFWQDTPRRVALVMNLARDSLSGAVAKRKAGLSSKELRFVAHRVASALNFMHQNYIIHRDLKASNILVDQDDSTGEITDVYLADFGLSRKRSEHKPFVTTPTGSTRWMSPENINKEPSDYTSDIWSYGMTLIEMITRQLPYHGVLVLDVPKMISKGTLPNLSWPSEPHDETMETLKSIVFECLKLDPKERPSALSIVKRLEL